MPGHLRQPKVDQIAEIVCGEAEFECDGTDAGGALDPSCPPRTTELLGARPQHRIQSALAGERADHFAAPAVGQQSQGPVQRGLAGAVGAGDDGEPTNGITISRNERYPRMAIVCSMWRGYCLRVTQYPSGGGASSSRTPSSRTGRSSSN